MIFVTPNNGLSIPDPVRNDTLPLAGRFVQDSQYWQRRINDGDVTVVPGAATPARFSRVRDEVLNFETDDDFNQAGGAAGYGVGPVWVAGVHYWSNSLKLQNTNAFTPSIFSGPKSATEEGVLQFEKFPTGATKIDLLNEDAVNAAYIGFGNSIAAAKQNRDSGVAGTNRFYLPKNRALREFIAGYSHWAWIGIGGTVTIQASIGV